MTYERTPISAFRAAERDLFAACELSMSEQWIGSNTDDRSRIAVAGEGEPVLYVHGGGAFGSIWAPLAAKLRGRKHLMPDRPGFGQSSFVPLRGIDFRRHAVEFLVRVLDHFEIDRVDVVGNSMGGLWSLWLALDAPHRVRHLVLLGAPAVTGGGSGPLQLRLLGQPILGRLLMAVNPPTDRSIRALWQTMGAPPDSVHDAVIAAWLASERLPHYPSAWRSVLAKVFTLFGPRPRYALDCKELGSITAPTLVIWGKRDPFGDVSMGERIADAIPQGRLALVEGCHQPWIDATDQCAEAASSFL